tara:strand:- start:115 stop:723 length:609 start_codon:yes stop_codon:yes gene_type:complete
MIIVLATTFYVRTIKTKLDTKVDAMFQLVQSLVNEVNQLKSTQVAPSTPKEVIQLDINSSNKLVVSENEHSAGEDSDDEDSDDEDSDDESYDDSSGSENDEDFLKKTVQITNDSPHEVNMHSDVAQEVIQEVAQELVQEVDLQAVDLQAVDIQIKSVQLDATESSDISFDSLNVKELKELVIKKGGKVTGKKKNDLIEFLLS